MCAQRGGGEGARGGEGGVVLLIQDPTVHTGGRDAAAAAAADGMHALGMACITASPHHAIPQRALGQTPQSSATTAPRTRFFSSSSSLWRCVRAQQ